MDTTNMPNVAEEVFWGTFAIKHRPKTVELARILSTKKVSREQFVALMSTDYERMPPNKARQIYDYLKMHGMLEYPEAFEEGD